MKQPFSLSGFLQYNNAVPIIFGILFLGTTATFAASPDARDAVLSVDRSIQSVDNTYIASVDLDSFPFSAQVTGVTEDSDNYYVAYAFATIDLEDSVWQSVSKTNTLTVSKAFLEDRDLGKYANTQITQVIDAERARLRETQKIERAQGVSQKMVATVYSGLVGKFIDPKEEELPAYTPPPEYAASADAGNPETTPSDGTTSEPAPASSDTLPPPPPVSNTSGNPDDHTPPVIKVFGKNPATLSLHDGYADLGASVTDNMMVNIGLHTFVDGVEMLSVVIDTSVSGTHHIVYRATDASGNTTEASRTVIVGTGVAPAPAASSTEPAP